MRLSSFVIAAAATLCLGAPSFAATIQAVRGPVSVNDGGGYHRVNSGAVANPGVIVMASPGGSAQVVYSDRCTVDVSPGATVTVQPQSPCALGQSSYLPYIAGGILVAGGGAAAAVLLSQKGGSAPAPLLPSVAPVSPPVGLSP